MKSASAFVIAAALLTAIPANAEVIDLANLKCKDLAVFPRERIESITIWLDGYSSDANDADSMRVDFDAVRDNASELKNYCTQNPESSVLAAAEEVLDK
jgi:hypothetical protein